MREVLDDGVLVVGGSSDAPTLAVRPLALVPGDVVPHAVVEGRGWLGKRAVDVVLSLVLLLISLPLFLLVAVAIKATSSGPVFFRQRRVGRGGGDFPMLKFRTMHADSEERLRSDPVLYQVFLESAHKVPAHLDPRVTGVGRLLRRFSLDELPQLVNVLRGHMSLVGPRPVERSQLIRDYGAFERVYVALRPGLTGLWQVSGRSTVQFPERAHLDSHYLEACGPWIDAKILLRTPRAIITGLGAE
jgi:exopolysaccharide production protein ExoY